MLSNEQRAHDYAIAVLNRAISAEIEKRQSLSNSEETRDKVDSFALYLDIYNRALQKLNTSK